MSCLQDFFILYGWMTGPSCKCFECVEKLGENNIFPLPEFVKYVLYSHNIN